MTLHERLTERFNIKFKNIVSRVGLKNDNFTKRTNSSAFFFFFSLFLQTKSGVSFCEDLEGPCP